MENSENVKNNDDTFELIQQNDYENTKIDGNELNVIASELKDDEEPTTSRRGIFVARPENTGDNMNDLQAIDINSADAIRQTMKAVLNGKVPPPYAPEFKQISICPVQDSSFLPMGQYLGPRLLSRPESRARRNKYIPKKKQKTGVRKQYALRIRERRRKLPAQGSSSRRRKQKVSSMYVGKLSNVLNYGRRLPTESDSDMDSALLYY